MDVSAAARGICQFVASLIIQIFCQRIYDVGAPSGIGVFDDLGKAFGCNTATRSGGGFIAPERKDFFQITRCKSRVGANNKSQKIVRCFNRVSFEKSNNRFLAMTKTLNFKNGRLR